MLAIVEKETKSWVPDEIFFFSELPHQLRIKYFSYKHKSHFFVNLNKIERVLFYTIWCCIEVLIFQVPHMFAKCSWVSIPFIAKWACVILWAVSQSSMQVSLVVCEVTNQLCKLCFLGYSFYPWGMCLVFGNVKSIIYPQKGTPQTTKETYFGLCETSFKFRYRNHTSSSRNERYRNATRILSKRFWGTAAFLVVRTVSEVHFG